MSELKFKDQKCGWSGHLKSDELFCSESVTERVRYSHNNYENDKYMWACAKHADELRE